MRYPDLPIVEHREEILAALRGHQVVVVAGETGSGKSTQLPKLCLEAGLAAEGRMIGHTQPRRIAARTIAERIAEELEEGIGGTVGYAVRFTDRVGPDTRVKVMTDGILLAELQRDRNLKRYDALIVDEAHERSLNIDFILGYLKNLLPKRPDLKVIVTSATIDTARFAEHFMGAPVVEVSGRTYPVEVRYRPYGEEPDDDRDQTQAIVDAIEELSHEGPGDVLVFLSGEREIRDTADALRRLDLRHTEVLPLYARLTAAEQHKVFQPHTGRRIVLATNVAETSLTVPGIRYVVDPGTARISRFNRRTKVQRLPIEDISQASANQRAGRCGRLGPGVCIRLYGEEDFQQRPEFTEPEILRTNLASVILQMTAIGLGDIARFPFVEPPDPRSVKDGVELLEELGALVPTKGRPKLTPVGRRLAQLPVDPRLARMILEADRNGVVGDVIVIAAALSIQDVRERPQDGAERQRAEELHRRFVDDSSDFLSILKLWAYVQEQQRALSSNQFRKLCKAEHLHHLRIREWQDLVSQLRQVAKSIDVRPHRHDPDDVDADGIHRSLLSGLLSHVGMRDGDRNEFLGARQARFAIQPGSVLHKKPPKWTMVAELVETNRLWGRTAARIQPEWAEKLGAHLVKRSYGDPWWDAAHGVAVAHERVTLYGIPVVGARRVLYSKVDPVIARDMVLWHALVEGEWETHHQFFHDNRKLLEELQGLEDRVRRRDLLVGPEAIFDFYDARVPEDVVSVRHFDRWWRDAKVEQPDLLTLTPEVLLDPRAGDVGVEAYPETWRQGDLTLALTYEFEPGKELDGVTVDVPLPLLAQVSPEGFDWNVPGLRAELVHALVRSLPKDLRRHLVPIPEQVDAFLDTHDPTDGPLLDVLGGFLGRRSGVAVRRRDFDLDKVPDHLRMTFRVVTERGRPLAWSKDLVALRGHLQTKLQASVSDAARSRERSGITEWDDELGTIPRTLELERGGHRVTVYPALVDEGITIGLRVLPTAEEQRVEHWVGTRRLLLLGIPAPVRAVRDILTEEAGFALTHAPREMADDCIRAAVDVLVARHGGPVWDRDAFEALRAAVKAGLPKTVAPVAADAGRILGAVGAVEARLDELFTSLPEDVLMDVRVQLARLVHPGFVTTTGADRLPDVLRYVRGIEHRLVKLPVAVAKDREHMRRIQALEAEHAEAGSPLDVFWMLQELRVATFAQVLGAKGGASEKKIRQALARR